MSHSKLMPWTMWVLTLLFFAYQFVLRLSPGLMINDIMLKFNVDATDYGYFASMYYYGYAGMQIPVALLLDRYGPKAIISICAFICGLATLTFIYADQWSVAIIGRFLIGAGSAAGFLGVSKVISMWFDSKDYGKMVGLTFTFGLMGAVFGGRPVSKLLDIFGWQDVLFYVALVSILLGVLILIFVRNSKDFVADDDKGITGKLKIVCTDYRILIIAAANLLLVGPLEGFADVWGVTYLTKAFGIVKSEAAFLTSFIFIGMMFGGPLLTYFAQKHKAHYQCAFLCGLLMFVLFAALLLVNKYISFYVVMAMMFMVGVCSSYQALVFTISAMIMPAYLMGVSIAFLNCINMLGGSLFHTVIGRTLDFLWDGQITDGVRVYDLNAYAVAISIIPIFCLFGGMLFLVVKRKTKRAAATNFA